MQVVNFYSRRKARAFADIYAGKLVDPDLTPELWRDGLDTWIVQTYLRLRQQSDLPFHCTLSAKFMPDAINVAHRDEASPWFRPASCYTVVIRADRPPVLSADQVVVQNPGQIGPNHTFIPFWPQPGLVPRVPLPTARFRNLAFLGRPEHLSSAFTDGGLQRSLAAMGINLELRRDRWYDYRDIDVVFAVRSEHPAMIASKPASKLINAWHAGVPAILGREPAYQLTGRPGVDYLEADTPAEMLAAITRLRDDPDFYQRMITAGKIQAELHSVAAVAKRWIEALSGDLAPDHSSGRFRFVRQRWRALQEHLLARQWRDR
ncbi:MAG: glycosyltransferase family 1 protein [Planctomycetes bacterium]|nr:glycosyltransferase family 1 protein [Planctomycetota bacterium]